MSNQFNEYNARTRQKRDTSANWTTNNPVLLNGEIILVDTADGNLRMKVGDGVKTYTQLPFTDEALRSLIAETYVSKAELAEILNALNMGFVATESDMSAPDIELYYTVRFYDGDTDTLLETRQVAYGDIPEYTPTKEKYLFTGWDKDVVAVTGDADYYAQWEEISFATSPWSVISSISESGNAANYFSVGDTRSEVIGGNTQTLEIIGFNHDDLSDGTGKAGITIWCKTAYKNVSLSQINSGSQDQPWITGALHNAEEAMFDDFSPELQTVVKEVNKKYLASARWNATVLTGAAKIWSLAAVTELNYSGTSYNSIGDAYEKFAGKSKTMGKTTSYDDIKTGFNYWVRGVQNTGNSYVSTTGVVKQVTTLSATSYAIAPCFCV